MVPLLPLDDGLNNRVSRDYQSLFCMNSGRYGSFVAIG